MTYTSHGHHIANSGEEFGDRPPIARCGGIGLCGKCSIQASAYAEAAAKAKVISDLDSATQHQGIRVPTEFDSIPVKIHAIQFMGGASDGMDIVAWIEANGGSATWNNAADPWTSPDGNAGHSGWPESLTIRTLEGHTEAPPGSWIIQGTEGEFYPCKDSVFQRKYKAVITN